MTLRKALLRAMLWSLGLAAAAGIVAALAGSGDTVWRVVGTGFVTAFACGLMLPFSSMFDQGAGRTVALSAVAAVLVEFLLALILIWEVPWLLFGLRWEDRLGLTMVFFGLTAILLALAARLAGQPHNRLAGRIGVGTTSVTFATFLIAIWGPGPPNEAKTWWESGHAVFTIGLLVLLSLVGAGSAPRRPWRWLALPAAMVTFVLWMSNVWIGSRSAFGTVLFSALVSGAAVIGHANLSLLVKLPSGREWMRWGAIAAAALTAVLINLVIVNQEYAAITWDGDLLGRLSAAAGIAAGCGTMALTILARIGGRADKDTPAAELTSVRVICPRCRKKQVIDIGGASCAACGLHISIHLAEAL